MRGISRVFAGGLSNLMKKASGTVASPNYLADWTFVIDKTHSPILFTTSYSSYQKAFITFREEKNAQFFPPTNHANKNLLKHGRNR